MMDLQRLAQFDPEHEYSANLLFVEFLLNNVEDVMLPLAEVDAQLYHRFEFTPAMINFVEERYDYDELYDAADHDTYAYKNLGETFTSPGVVFFMILNDGMRGMIQDVDKTMFDAAVGEGQFPCAELVLKMFYAIDKLDENTAVRALASLYGVDIQESSVEKTIVHLSDTLCAAYKFFTGKEFTAATDAADIICKNFIVGDSFKLIEKWAKPRQSLFD